MHIVLCADVENGCMESNKWSNHEGNEMLNRPKWADGREENRKCADE